jgi:hypothetical protein
MLRSVCALWTVSLADGRSNWRGTDPVLASRVGSHPRRCGVEVKFPGTFVEVSQKKSEVEAWLFTLSATKPKAAKIQPRSLPMASIIKAASCTAPNCEVRSRCLI